MNQTLFHVNYDESISCSTVASDIDNESIETSYFTTFEDEEEEEEYDPTKLSPQQLKTGQEIVQAIISGNNRWLILLAQMQSGKTETYLFVCCEIIRLAIAKQVVIFSGNSETDLKKQLLKEVADEGDAKFYDKYCEYLMKDMHLTLTQTLSARTKAKISIKLCWGTELNKYTGPTTETLFIWEEAHHAQSIHQCPDKFLKKVGISADGDRGLLEEKQNYVISVSATPFSELSDVFHLEQNKLVVPMKAGRGYNSVKKIRDSGHLKSFSTVEEGLNRALNTPRSEPKYAIVRITNKNEETVTRIIRENGWEYVTFDSVSDADIKAEGVIVWNGMAVAPLINTVILLRGKCRMGHNLKKNHLLFVMETAKNSKTDTVLQGLLGRVCGFSEGSDKVDVYLHKKIVDSDELDRYIKCIEYGDEILPMKARNLTDKKISKNIPIIPIKILRDLTRFPTNDRAHIIADVNDAFCNHNGDRISNKNTNREFDEVRQKFLSNYNSNKSLLKAFYLDKDKKTRNETVATKLQQSFDRGLAERFGSGCGIDSDGCEVNIWVPKNIQGFSKDYFYVTAHVTNETYDANKVPETTRREVFAHRLEDGTGNVCNGGLIIPLCCESADNVNVMLSEIKELIDISSKRENCTGKITSCWDNKDEVYKGIRVSPIVLRALEAKGTIQMAIQAEYGITLKIEKSKGTTPKQFKEKGFTKLASISW
jgi:hypothetical protein